MRYSFLTGRLPPTSALRKEKAEFTALWKCPRWDRPGPSSLPPCQARCPRCGPRSRGQPLQGKSCLSFRAFPPAKIRQPLPDSLTFFQKTARNKSELPLLLHMEDTGTFCCRSSPFSSFCLQHPHPTAPQKRTGGHATHPAGPSTFKAPPGGAPLALPALTHVLQVGGGLRTPLLPGADVAASAFGTGSPWLLKATALHLWETRARP